MKLTVREISLVAIFPAMMAATAGISIPLGTLPPISLQTLFVFLSGLLLGGRLGALSMTIYVMLGVIGIPVFSGFRGGIGVITGGSGGFIIGFIFAAYFIGKMKTVIFINKNILGLAVVLFVANLIIYMLGATYIAYLTSSSIFTILATFGLYMIGDSLKIVAAIYVYLNIRKKITYEGLQI